jgi:hypothetical protein
MPAPQTAVSQIRVWEFALKDFGHIWCDVFKALLMITVLWGMMSCYLVVTERRFGEASRLYFHGRQKKDLDGRNGRKQGIVLLTLQRCMNRKKVCCRAFVTPLTFESAATTWLAVFDLRLVQRCCWKSQVTFWDTVLILSILELLLRHVANLYSFCTHLCWGPR